MFGFHTHNNQYFHAQSMVLISPCIATICSMQGTISGYCYTFNCTFRKSGANTDLKNSCLYHGKLPKFQNYGYLLSFWQGSSLERGRYNLDISCKVKVRDRDMNFPPVQTLRKFPIDELHSKIVMVRFDSSILLQQNLHQQLLMNSAYLTIKYLYKAGAKIILTSSWNVQQNDRILSEEIVAEFLSSVLELSVVTGKHNFLHQLPMMEQFELADITLLENLCNYKQEFGNSSEFSKILSYGVDIFVNDSFSSAHKILASTVGVTQFCSVCLAGFYFEDCVNKLKKIPDGNQRPYVVVVGGRTVTKKASAVYSLASRCDGLIFVGMMAFQLMHIMGLHVPLNLINKQCAIEALELMKIAKQRSIPILLPKDFCCKHRHLPIHMKTFSAENILEGCKSLLKIVWIGPLQLVDSGEDVDGASKLAHILADLSQIDCHISIIGRKACETVLWSSRSASSFDMIESAPVVWESLRGRFLPGLLALDRAYPLEIDWNKIYPDPTKPLAVDIGSGNGLFLIGMAKSQKNFNFLGLEMNEKLVLRCLDAAQQSGLLNLHFIATNATSSFRMIVSSYPGPVELVSIQCPNPDFNQPEHRWRMVQKSLIEAIADELDPGGKVFLQSDIKEVAHRMRKQFLTEGKQKLIIEGEDNDAGGWLNENPFGVRSDWERHVLARGLPMFRLMLYKR